MARQLPFPSASKFSTMGGLSNVIGGGIRPTVVTSYCEVRAPRGRAIGGRSTREVPLHTWPKSGGAFHPAAPMREQKKRLNSQRLEAKISTQNGDIARRTATAPPLRISPLPVLGATRERFQGAASRPVLCEGGRNVKRIRSMAFLAR